jgi:hypothetical protein
MLCYFLVFINDSYTRKDELLCRKLTVHFYRDQCGLNILSRMFALSTSSVSSIINKAEVALLETLQSIPEGDNNNNDITIGAKRVGLTTSWTSSSPLVVMLKMRMPTVRRNNVKNSH